MRSIRGAPVTSATSRGAHDYVARRRQLEHGEAALGLVLEVRAAPATRAADEVSPLVALDRGWREFVASEGLLHVGAGFATFPLGVIPATGSLTRPILTPLSAWARAYAGVELQVVARVAGQDRYSEPRTLQSVFPGVVM